jgi:superfamily II DNA or RNA helicase
LKGHVEPIIRRAIARTLTYVPRDMPRVSKKNAQVQNDTGILEESLLCRAPTGEWYFPVGVLPRVLEVLNTIDYDYRVENDVELPGDPIGLEWKTDKVLYPYQKEAAEIAYLNSGGTVCLPTGAGKTLICLRLIYAFDHRTLILVHSRELMKQWRAAIKNTFGVDPGMVGGSFKENWDDVTIASVQTIASRIKRGKVDTVDLNYPVMCADECLPYDTPVVTSLGILKIGDIVEFRLPVNVLTHTGKYQRVVAYQKIPLVKRLVRVTHGCGSFVCTEDHKIHTQRGWVEAIELNDADVVYVLTEEWGERNGVCVQDLRKGIYTPERGGRARGPCSFSECEGVATGSVESAVGRGIGIEEARGGGSPGTGEVKAPGRGSAHGEAAAVDSRKPYGRHEYPVPEFEEPVSESDREAIFCTSGLRTVEVLSVEESRRIATEIREKRGMGIGECRVQHPIAPVLDSNLRSCEDWEGDAILGCVAFGGQFFDCARGVVYGRRDAGPEQESGLPEGLWAHNSGVTWRFDARRDGVCGSLDGSGMGDIGAWEHLPEKSIESQTRGECVDSQVGRHRCIPGHCPAACGSVPEVQGDEGLYVYDMTVEEDHSFVASGVTVRNCHHMPANDVYGVAMLYNSPVRIGLSATPYRTDGREMKIWGAIGDICARITPVDLIKRGYLTEPRFVILDPPYVKMRRVKDWNEAYYDGIVANQYRNQMIVDTARELMKKGHKVYIHVERIEHGEILAIMFDDVPFIHGSSPKTERDETIGRFAGDELNCVISTLLGEGVDIPTMTAIIMAGGLKTPIGVVQKVGRALRKSPGKKEAVIVDFRDNGAFLARHFQERMDIYRETYGEYVDAMTREAKRVEN